MLEGWSLVMEYGEIIESATVRMHDRKLNLKRN